MYNIITSIDKALQKGTLQQPFGSSDFKVACPGFAENTYHTFLSKHSVCNPGRNTEYFKRVKRGLYNRISAGIK